MINKKQLSDRILMPDATIQVMEVKRFIAELKENLKEYWDDDGCFVLSGVIERIDKLSGFALHETKDDNNVKEDLG